MFKRVARAPAISSRGWWGLQLVIVIMLALLLVALTVSIAHAQGIPRGGTLRCRNLPAGVTATAMLQWTQGGRPIVGATDTWTCTDNTTDTHDTVQPENANDWELTITFTGPGGGLGTCMDSDPLFFAGHPQNFTSRCRLSPAGATFKLARPGP